jgi:6-pyruvoyltetrahydropterin/6-carboxytetrahydropterin synthase
MMVAKKCENLHGHNWRIEVCLVGETLNNAGVLMDFGVFKKILSEIIERLDHKFLNELEYFNDSFPPSSENIAYHITNELQASINDPLVKVSSVTAWESENACATYIISD